MTDFEPTDTELAAIGRAVRRLSGYGRDNDAIAAVARSALWLLTSREPEDPPLFATLAMPTWNQPSAPFPIVERRPLLDLLEV